MTTSSPITGRQKRRKQRFASPPKPSTKASPAPSTPDVQAKEPQIACPQHDIMTVITMLLESLATSRRSGEETEQTADANSRLTTSIMNYLAMMRKRTLSHCYEFLVPLGGPGMGWYWRHPKFDPKDSKNWHGPYVSRKAAITARISQKGALRVPMDVLDRMIFGEEDAEGDKNDERETQTLPQQFADEPPRSAPPQVQLPDLHRLPNPTNTDPHQR